MAVDRTGVFSVMPVRRAVLRQILPAVASQMIALVYNLADTYFVGLLNDPEHTAAVTVGAASFVMLTAISNLFGVGGGSSIARALGRGDGDAVKQLSAIAFWGGLLSALAFAGAYRLLAGWILPISGATDITYGLSFGYVKWVVMIGGPFTIMNTLMANLVRAEGSASCASIGVSLGGLLNILLDPIFVLPRFLGLGAVGAGMATAISNAASALFFLCYILLRRDRTVLSISPRHISNVKAHLKPMLSIGFPSALQMGLTVVAASAQLNFVSKYSTEAVAAYGIVKKLDQLPLYFSIGVASGLLPMLAYNHSAGNHRRRSQAFRFGTGIAVGFSLLCLAAYELFAPGLAALFIDDPLTVEYSADFLRRMVTAMPLMSVCYPMIIQFQAMGRVRESLISSVLRKGLLDIPLLFVLDSISPLYGCMWVQPIVDSIALAAVLVFYRRIQRQQAGTA